MRVLVVNAGSSSLKLRLLGADDELLESIDLPAADDPVSADAIREAFGGMHRIDAVGHRIVHGGTEFREAVIVDDDVLRRLEALSDLAPLHQPKSLAALRSVSAHLPHTPAVACFDTAFHASIPDAAATYALPREWRERWPLRRFGFHGLSHAYAARRAAELLHRPAAQLRVVTCHMGAGASLTAVDGGRSMDTTMGFTPLEGLVMATRSGNVDPGLVLWLEQHGGLTAEELASALEERSGLLGLAGRADMRAVLEAEARGNADATLAVSVYVHRLRQGIAAMTASMGGLDALVFTGGGGERASAVRRRAAGGLGFLGITVDASRNQAAVPDCDISSAAAGVATLVVEAREDLEIARQVRTLLTSSGRRS
jgi:acetate kinase